MKKRGMIAQIRAGPFRARTLFSRSESRVPARSRTPAKGCKEVRTAARFNGAMRQRASKRLVRRAAAVRIGENLEMKSPRPFPDRGLTPWRGCSYADDWRSDTSQKA